jgi:hypothetical protein
MNETEIELLLETEVAAARDGVELNAALDAWLYRLALLKEKGNDRAAQI